MGPLPRIWKVNQYVLVISGYPTRYSEAIPISNFTEVTIVKELINLLSRYGIPEEILTDQEANLISALLGELYRMLGIKAIWPSPYHPQTDSLVEWFNKH